LFRIKICGITSVEDALAVAAAGADAIGLNFYSESPRFIAQELAQQIVDALPPGIVKVGLFVNAPVAAVRACAQRLDLDLVQLHGEEPPAYLAELSNFRIMRAFGCGEEGLAPCLAYLQACDESDCRPALVLLDGMKPGMRGGTGKRAVIDPARIAEVGDFVLAGGLTPENVAEAIREFRPLAVDTASGVESSPGRKDPAKLTAFVRAARAAWSGLD
jgi:phosphoribosylanthranilate isomerase